jgi:hypothetical protein
MMGSPLSRGCGFARQAEHGSHGAPAVPEGRCRQIRSVDRIWFSVFFIRLKLSTCASPRRRARRRKNVDDDEGDARDGRGVDVGVFERLGQQDDVAGVGERPLIAGDADDRGAVLAGKILHLDSRAGVPVLEIATATSPGFNSEATITCWRESISTPRGTPNSGNFCWASMATIPVSARMRPARHLPTSASSPSGPWSGN